MTDYITPSDHKMFESNLQSIMILVWIMITMSLINIAVWY